MTTEYIIELIKNKMEEWDKARKFHEEQVKIHPEDRAHHERQADHCTVRYVTLLHLLDEIEQGNKQEP